MEVVVGALRTPPGMAAVHRAAELVEQRGGRLHLVGHVSVPRDQAGADDYQRQVRALEDEIRAWAPEEVGAADWDVEVPSGHRRPSHAILHVAERIGADLVAIGLRQRSRVAVAVLGSTAQEILLGSRCPVLAVPVVDAEAG